MKYEISEYKKEYASAFYLLNRDWILESWDLEDADVKNLLSPEKTIIELGGEVRQLSSVNFFYRVLNNSRNNSIPNETLLKQRIFKNHSNLYLENGLDSTNLLWELRKSDEVISSLELIKKSAEYKVGEIIMLPYRFIQNLIRQF